MLLLCVTCLGAMTAEDTDERGWFLTRTVKLARSLGIKIEQESIRQPLQSYLFLKREDGSRRERIGR